MYRLYQEITHKYKWPLLNAEGTWLEIWVFEWCVIHTVRIRRPSRFSLLLVTSLVSLGHLNRWGKYRPPSSPSNSRFNCDSLSLFNTRFHNIVNVVIEVIIIITPLAHCCCRCIYHHHHHDVMITFVIIFMNSLFVAWFDAFVAWLIATTTTTLLSLISVSGFCQPQQNSQLKIKKRHKSQIMRDSINNWSQRPCCTKHIRTWEFLYLTWIESSR